MTLVALFNVNCDGRIVTYGNTFEAVEPTASALIEDGHACTVEVWAKSHNPEAKKTEAKKEKQTEAAVKPVLIPVTDEKDKTQKQPV